MKRKIKKFADGGLAGIQKSSLDIAQGTGMLEQGIQRIKGGSGVGGSGVGGSSSVTNNSPNLYAQLTTSDRTVPGNSPMQSDSVAMGAAQEQPYLGFKKGGAVKAKSKNKPRNTKTTSKRGDGIAQRGKTRGRMV